MNSVDWMSTDAGADAVEQRLYDLKVIPCSTTELPACSLR
jgi:hypothetical protein